MALEAFQVILTKEPEKDLIPDEHFAVEPLPAPLSESDLKDDHVLIEILYLSLDPVSRTWLHPGTYITVNPGEKMAGYALVRVLASASSSFAPGDFARTWCGWTTHAIIAAEELEKIDVLEGTAVSDYLGYLGFTGLTGYFGMTKLGKVEREDTVVVNTAAGATGSIAAQVAKLAGAGRVVGITGTANKVKWLKEVAGLDEAINYRDADFEEQFAKAVPDGIDVYYDNVGGRQLELGLEHINKWARIVICGNVGNYNDPNAGRVTNIFKLALKAATMHGCNIFEFLEEAESGVKTLHRWARDGKLKSADTVIKGTIKDAPHVLADLFEGKNMGKMLLELKNPDA